MLRIKIFYFIIHFRAGEDVKLVCFYDLEVSIFFKNLMFSQ